MQAELEPGLQARFDFVAGQMSLLATSSPLLSPFQIDRRSAAPVCLLGRPPKPTPSTSPAVAAAASPQDATKTRSPAPTPATATAEPAEAASPMHAFLDAVALALWGVREGGILEDAVRLSLRHLHLPFVSHTNHLRLKAPFLTARYPPPLPHLHQTNTQPGRALVCCPQNSDPRCRGAGKGVGARMLRPPAAVAHGHGTEQHSAAAARCA